MMKKKMSYKTTITWESTGHLDSYDTSQIETAREEYLHDLLQVTETFVDDSVGENATCVEIRIEELPDDEL